MLTAHFPTCKADLTAAGLRARYIDSTEKVLERIKTLARAYDRTRRLDLFICHSFKDRPFAEQLAIEISEEGFKSWFAEFEMKVGDSLMGQDSQSHQAIRTVCNRSVTRLRQIPVVSARIEDCHDTGA